MSGDRFGRGQLDEALQFELKRDVIRIKSVRHHIEQNNVGYIRVTTFNENTVNGVEAAIADIKKQVGDEKLLGYILDLRNNPGGLLDQAVGLGDMFLDKGEIVSTRGRNEDDNKRNNATHITEPLSSLHLAKQAQHTGSQIPRDVVVRSEGVNHGPDRRLDPPLLVAADLAVRVDSQQG